MRSRCFAPLFIRLCICKQTINRVIFNRRTDRRSSVGRLKFPVAIDGSMAAFSRLSGSREGAKNS